MVALIALAGFSWLITARFTWPKLLPYVRVALVGAFYLSLVVLLLIGVKGV
jgi:glycerol uptake facilitator-like aquaporin